MKILSACASLLIVLLLVACNLESGDDKSFDVDLQGTWVSNDSSVYSGALIIEHDRITITGYSENQTSEGGNDNRRPFREFVKGIALKGYSEDGKIYIEDGGQMQKGIPYYHWDDNPGYIKMRFLRFNFDGRTETLQKLVS
jgi:hypothetical protein